MIVTKAVALVDSVETEDPNGAFEVILSAATLDRDGEVIDSRAFDPLPDHIPFDIDHGMTVTTTVGSGAPYYADDGSLRVKGTFASTGLAQDVRTLVAEGHVRTTSVTFMAAERSPDEKGVQHVTSAELLNGTFTPVPSNREAVVLSAKALHAATDQKVGARNSSSDAASLQEAHDILVGLGAICTFTSADDGEPKSAILSALAEGILSASEVRAVMKSPQFKSVVGSLEATQDRVRDALNDAYGTDAYVWLRATIPADSGDSCVYEIDATDGSECETYQESYTDDGAVVTLAGDATLVDLTEEIVPDADADTEPADALKSADRSADTAAKAAEPTVKSTDEEAMRAALLAINENAAQLAFGG